MSIYSSQIKTHIVDPVYNSSTRAEFRLPTDTVILSNMRLINIGTTGTGGGDTFNGLLGSLGVIRQISLYDDNVLLDQLLNVPEYLGFLQYNKTNSENMDLYPQLHQNRAGNQYKGISAGAGQEGDKVTEYVIANANQGAITADEATTNTSWLKLSDLLPILNSTTAFNTNVMDGLKVVVEYNDTDGQYVAHTMNRTPYKPVESQLVCDEVIGDVGKDKLGQFTQINYTSIEHDRATVPNCANLVTAAGPVATQSQTLHINGFNNKAVGRMLICKSPANNNWRSYGGANPAVGPSGRMGKVGSVGFNKEVLQCRVNGKPLIAGSGINRDNQRLGMLHDVWGRCSTYPFGNGQAFVAPDNVNRSTVVQGNGYLDLSCLDFYGLSLNDKVEDLQIDFSRQAVYSNATGGGAAADNVSTLNASSNQEITLNMYCEVYKAIVPTSNGSYNVVYM